MIIISFFKIAYIGKKLTRVLYLTLLYLNLPPDTSLPGRNESVPYVFVSDGTFTLHKHIIKPYVGNHSIGTKERTFNYKLSSSRVVVENVFGVLTSAFRIFQKPIEIEIDNVPLVTMTCILLHIFLRNSKYSRDIYTPPGTFDSLVDESHVDGLWRQNFSDTTGIRSLRRIRRSSNGITEIRNEFAN